MYKYAYGKKAETLSFSHGKMQYFYSKPHIFLISTFKKLAAWKCREMYAKKKFGQLVSAIYSYIWLLQLK